MDHYEIFGDFNLEIDYLLNLGECDDDQGSSRYYDSNKNLLRLRPFYLFHH